MMEKQCAKVLHYLCYKSLIHYPIGAKECQNVRKSEDLTKAPSMHLIESYPRALKCSQKHHSSRTVSRRAKARFLLLPGYMASLYCSSIEKDRGEMSLEEMYTSPSHKCMALWFGVHWKCSYTLNRIDKGKNGSLLQGMGCRQELCECCGWMPTDTLISARSSTWQMRQGL